MGVEREKQPIRAYNLRTSSGITADTGNITASSGGFSAAAASTFAGAVTLSSGVTVTKTLTCSSGATFGFGTTFSKGINVTSGVTVGSGLALSSGVFTIPVVASPTTGTLTNQGVSRLTATTASKNWVLAPPALGAVKIIAAGSTLALTVTCTTGTYFHASTHADGAGASTALVTATFNDGTDCLTLCGMSTLSWMVTANVGTVALS